MIWKIKTDWFLDFAISASCFETLNQPFLFDVSNFVNKPVYFKVCSTLTYTTFSIVSIACIGLCYYLEVIFNDIFNYYQNLVLPQYSRVSHFNSVNIGINVFSFTRHDFTRSNQ